MTLNQFVLLCLFLGFVACKNNSKPVPLFQLLPKDSTGIDFTNIVVDNNEENSFLFRNFYNGSGVAIGDINNDGLADVFFTSNSSFNKLYLNKGNFKFEDISDKAGIIKDDKWNTGVVFADVNADGWLDIYVCASGHMRTGNRQNKLYINQKNNTFTEEAEKYGLAIKAYTTQVSFFDYDLDGDLDCFMINNSPVPINQLNFSNLRDMPESEVKVGEFLKGGGDHLYKNENGKFVEVTKQAGLHGGLIAFGLGVSVSDINNDGWPDVFVSNDSYERDYLYINQKNGKFKDELEQYFQHTSFSSMGADIADINNDGNMDLFSTDMLPMNDLRMKTTGSFDNIDIFNSKLQQGFFYQYTKNCLQLNNGNNKFIDIARYAGVAATDWSWGALMFDMDNDAWNDLLVCNGVNRDVTNLDFMDFFANDVIQKMVLTGKKDELDKVVKEIPIYPVPNKVYKNNRRLDFTDIGEQWGLGQNSLSNGAAYGDLDNDGDLDLIICNQNEPAFVYRNNARQQTQNDYISFELKGLGNNPFAVGTRVQLFLKDTLLTQELFPSRGFQSSVDYKMVFGLGKNLLDSVRIFWPNLTYSTIVQPAINKLHILKQAEMPAKKWQPSATLSPTYFQELPTQLPKHQENQFVDFYYERNIPRVLSREGPKGCVGDVNKDGLEDIYIGGSKQQQGQLYLQTQNGQFIPKKIQNFEQFSSFEDGACLFLDYDKDGDLDLIICPSGNENNSYDREAQVRLFKNDGQGNFLLDPYVFEKIGANISVAIAHDINNDGYPDLFFGGRNITGRYGIDPPSFILMNDQKGKFKNVTEALSPAIAHIGMVTGASFANILGDATKELIIVGEWMAPKIFEYKDKKYQLVKTNLNEYSGWWQSLATADLNGDGKEDLILGNTGENAMLHPTFKDPVKLWINDYDGNGNLDKIITYTVNGKDVPVVLKRDLEEQIPAIKKHNLKHKDFANKSIQDLFSPEILSKANVKLYNYTPSVVAYNQGNGNFEIQKLPVIAQLSCINAIYPTDINKDGKIDLVYGGNQFGFLPQYEKLDASFGEILLNQGNQKWQVVSAKQIGLNVGGELKAILPIAVRKEDCLIFLQNSEKPLLYKFGKL